MAVSKCHCLTFLDAKISLIPSTNMVQYMYSTSNVIGLSSHKDTHAQTTDIKRKSAVLG